MKLQEQLNRIQEMMGTLNEEISEEINAKEAYTEYNSVKTIIDGKRDIAFTTLFSPIVSIMIMLNGLKKMKLPQSDNYIIYRKDAIDKAKELYDIANKYGGFLHYNATEEDSRKIGKLLGYKESDIENYIERNRKIRTNLPEQLNRIQEMMGVNDCNYELLNKIADELSDTMYCERFGSCVHFAELFTEKVNEVNPNLLDCFDVIEGYVKTNDGKFEHTWIETNDKEKIDPTKIQFGTIKKITKKKTYGGEEYLKDKTDTWFSERRKQFPQHIFKN